MSTSDTAAFVPSNPSGIPARTPVPAPVVRAFAAGSVGTGGFGVLPGLVLAYYLTDGLGVSAWWATIVVLLPKIADVLVDPVIGRLSDRTASTDGDRSRLMKTGAFILAPSFALTFCAPAMAGAVPAAIWVVVFFVLSSIAFSLFQVPYIALPAELSVEPGERTRLVSIRIAVLSAAILAVGGGGPALRDAVGGTAGYLVMGIAVGAILGAGMLWTAYGAAPAARYVPGTSTRFIETTKGSSNSPQPSISSVVDRRYLVLLAAFVVQALGTAVLLGSSQYAATYLLDSSTAVTGLFAALVLPAVFVMGPWQTYARRHGKRAAYLLASAIYVVGAILLFPAVGTGGLWVYAATVIVGVGYAGTQAMPLAILADLLGTSIGDDTDPGHRTGSAGVLAGLWTASETVAMALGPAVVLAVLGASGFVSSTADDAGATPQNDSALFGITVVFSLVPALFIALGGILIALNNRTTQSTNGTTHEVTHQPGGSR